MATTLIHDARAIDAGGVVDEAWVLFDDDAIAAVGAGADAPAADETVDAAGARLVPGFIDIHVHGGGGHAFDDGPDDIAAALAVHRAHGTTRSVLSLVTNPVDRLCASLAAIADLTETDPLVLGAHLEGPFLEHGHRGAHHPDLLVEPDRGTVDRLLRAARGTLRQITLAPELPGAMAAIDALTAEGVVVAVGHTSADADLARAAFDRGARILTHAFNGMQGIHHRAPGPVVAAFDDDRVTLELILDGMHVHESVARMAFRSAPGRIALITDAMAAAGAPDGAYRLGSLDVDVRDGLAVVRGTSSIAGSTLTLDAALRRALAAGVDPVDAVAAVTSVPARALGLDDRFGRVAPGYAADAVLLEDDGSVRAVWAAGARLTD